MKCASLRFFSLSNDRIDERVGLWSRRRLKATLLITLLGGVSLTSCAPTPDESSAPSPDESPLRWYPLVEGDAWRILDPEADPYRAALVGRTRCDRTDFGEEYGGVELSTVRCGYLTLSQGLQRSIARGALIELQFWHSSLVSERPHEGLIALRIGEEELLRQPISIPADAKSWTLRWESERALDVDTEVLFHVHNHGANSYVLYRLSVGLPEEMSATD